MSPLVERVPRAAANRACRSLRRVALVSVAAGALALTLASGASAGTYVIDNCPSAGSDDAGSWAVFGSPQNVKGTCSGGPGDYIGPRGGSMSPGNTAGVQIGVPAGSGITIIEAKVWWQAAHQIGGADTFAIAADNDGAVGESTTPMTGSEPSTYVLPSTTTEITLANYCSNDDAGAGCTFGSGENNILELYGSRLTLQDTTLPSGTVMGGALASSGTVSGASSISYQAADTSSGVRLVQLRVDGEPVAVRDYLASCSYTNFQACPPSVSDTVSWNTATVANGEHRVELVVEDAAQNTSVIYSGEVTIQNSSKTSPLGALPGPGSTGLQTLGIGNANGIRASEKAELQLGLPATITRSYAHRAIVISGRTARRAGPADRARQPGCAGTDRRRSGAGGHRPRHNGCRWHVQGACRQWTVAADRRRLPRVLRRRWLCGSRARQGDGGRRGPAAHQPDAHRLGRDDRALGDGRGTDPAAGHDRGPPRALPWPLGAVQDASHERTWALSGALPVRGWRRALPVSRRGAWRSGGVSVRQRGEPGGECQHWLGVVAEDLAGCASWRCSSRWRCCGHRR